MAEMVKFCVFYYRFFVFFFKVQEMRDGGGRSFCHPGSELRTLMLPDLGCVLPASAQAAEQSRTHNPRAHPLCPSPP